MKTLYAPALLTKEIFEQLNPAREYVMLGSIDKLPYALVSKSWLERRINSVQILFPVSHRFILPDDKDIIKIALLFNDGKIEEKKLTDMVAMAQFIIDRLNENGNVKIPSSKEK